MRVSPAVRTWIVVLLTACAVALIVLTRFAGRAGSSQVQQASPRSLQGEKRTILQQVEGVAAAFHIPRGAMRLPPARQTDSGVPEIRLQVSPEFSSFEFHSALAGSLADLGATVIGTEHRRDRSIALQILKDGAPVMMVVLDLRTSPQQQRKESRH